MQLCLNNSRQMFNILKVTWSVDPTEGFNPKSSVYEIDALPFGYEAHSSKTETKSMFQHLWHKGPKPVVCRELFTEIQAKIGERGFELAIL